MQKSNGILIMLPSGIEEDNLLQYIPNEVAKHISDTIFFAVENLRSARRFIKKIKKDKDIDTCTFHEINLNSTHNDYKVILNYLLDGNNVAMISESGCPGIADPGQQLALLAHENEIKVIPLVEPSSILLALMASGQNGQLFKFLGYLPKEPANRRSKLIEIEKEIMQSGISILFIETPYRNQHVFDAICSHMNNSILLTIACEIKSNNEYIKTKKIAEWKKSKPNLDKKNTVFILGKGK